MTELAFFAAAIAENINKRNILVYIFTTYLDKYLFGIE